MIATGLSRERAAATADRYLQVLAENASERAAFVLLRSDADVAQHISAVTGHDVSEADVVTLAEYIAEKQASVINAQDPAMSGVIMGTGLQHPATGAIVDGVGIQHPAMSGIIEGVGLQHPAIGEILGAFK